MVYFSHHIYNRFVDSLLTDDLHERNKTNLCEITEYNDEVIKSLEESHKLRMKYVRFLLDHYDRTWDDR